MSIQNINLPGHQVDFIRKNIEQGRYKDVSEVIGAGLRLLEQQEAEDKIRLEALQHVAEAAFAALDRGEYTSFTPATLNDWLDQIDRNISLPVQP